MSLTSLDSFKFTRRLSGVGIKMSVEQRDHLNKTVTLMPTSAIRKPLETQLKQIHLRCQKQ